MPSLGRDIGGEILAVSNLGAAAGSQATLTGAAVDISALRARAESVCAIVAVRGVMDDGDNLTVDQIKLQSATASAFSTPVDRVTASTVTITGGTGDNGAIYNSVAVLNLDLTQLPEAHKFIRLSVRSTLDDAVNSTGTVAGVLVFGGLTSV